MTKNNSLQNFKLQYEDMEKKRVKTTKAVKKDTKKVNKLTVKKRVNNILLAAKKRYTAVVKKTKHPRKAVRKLTKTERELAKKQRQNVILGIGLLLVVASIIYSTYVIYIGVDSSASRVALLPQAVFATLTLLKAFSKLYK